MKKSLGTIIAATALLSFTAQTDNHGHEEKLCLDAGPQTPRDI